MFIRLCAVIITNRFIGSRAAHRQAEKEKKVAGLHSDYILLRQRAMAWKEGYVFYQA